MTKAFEYFLDQFNASSRTKADGYDLSHFDELTDSEKDQAFNLLKQEVLAPGVIKWLDYLNHQKAYDLALETLQKHGVGFSGTQRILSYLHTIDNNPTPIKQLITDYKKYRKQDREQIIWIVKSSNIDIDIKVGFYQSVLAVEINTDTAISAADFLLVAYGYTRSSKEEKDSFYSIRDDLASNDFNKRSETIENLQERE